VSQHDMSPMWVENFVSEPRHKQIAMSFADFWERPFVSVAFVVHYCRKNAGKPMRKNCETLNARIARDTSSLAISNCRYAIRRCNSGTARRPKRRANSIGVNPFPRRGGNKDVGISKRAIPSQSLTPRLLLETQSTLTGFFGLFQESQVACCRIDFARHKIDTKSIYFDICSILFLTGLPRCRRWSITKKGVRLSS